MNKKDVSQLLCAQCMSQRSGNVCEMCGFDNSGKAKRVNDRVLMPGTVIDERFAVGKVVCTDRLSTVYYGYDILNDKRVIVECVIDKYNRMDIYSHSAKDIEGIVKSASTRLNKMADLKCKNIIPYTDFFEFDGSFYYVCDYYNGKTLTEYMNEKGTTLRVSDTIDILKKVAFALDEMYAAGLVCATLAPNRIIIDDDLNVSIKDTNYVALKFSDSDKREMLAASCYIPCEFYTQDFEITQAADVYSLAACAYKMLTGKDIDPASDREYEEDIQDPREMGVNITSEGFDVICKALSVYPDDRTKTARQFLADFERENETVIEIERDIESNFSDLFNTKNEEPEKAEDDSKKKRKKKSNSVSDLSSESKHYRGISPVLKIVVISILAVLLGLAMAVFKGFIDPAKAFVSKQVGVPDVCGIQVENARAILHDKGLNILITGANFGSKQVNSISRQNPYADEKTIVGDVVFVTVSLGENNVSKGCVPNVVYMNLADAYETLTQYGYEIKIEIVKNDEIMAGCVVAQSEHAGIELAKGEAITLEVSGGSLLQSERIRVSKQVSLMNAVAVFMDDDDIYAIKSCEAGKSLGSLMPIQPSAIGKGGLEFIGWSRGENGTGGEFTSESTFSGVLVLHAFFASRGTVIETATPEPTVSIDIETTPTLTNTPVVIPTETLDPDITGEIITEEPTLPPIVLTEQPTATPTATPTPTPTPTPKPTPTPTPTPTPKPTPVYYLDGIELSETSVTLEVGKNKWVKLIIDGHTKYDLEYKCRSSNKAVATIEHYLDDDFIIKARGEGSTWVYVTVNTKDYGMFEASCKVTVKATQKGLTANITSTSFTPKALHNSHFDVKNEIM